jgi:hypothetical protein
MPCNELNIFLQDLYSFILRLPGQTRSEVAT